MSALAVVCTLIPAALWSQAGTSGTISGTITDSSGAYLSGATLTLKDLGTNTVRTMQSGSGGVYAFTNLPPASYDLTVRMQGFRAVEVENIKLDVAASRRI